MRIRSRSQRGAVIAFDMDELSILNNALAYLCHAVDLPEFATVIGGEREEALALLAGINGLLTHADGDAGST